MISFYGKLPTAGDFLTVEVPREILRPLEDWLNASLATSRQETDGDWQAIFDAAPSWRFWIGDEVLGRRICGVMKPSLDKVGRRFPAVLFASDAEATELGEAPVVDDDQEFYENLEGELGYLATLSSSDISERIKAMQGAGSTLGTPGEVAKPAQDFWAVAPEAGAEGLKAMVADAGAADHIRATSDRSYWWSSDGGGGFAALYATRGLPQPQVFAWFLKGLEQAGFANPDEGA